MLMTVPILLLPSVINTTSVCTNHTHHENTQQGQLHLGSSSRDLTTVSEIDEKGIGLYFWRWMEEADEDLSYTTLIFSTQQLGA